MTDSATTSRTEVDEDRMEQAMENTQPIIDLGKSLVDAGVASAASEAGRTVEEQWERMGDHYEYQAVEQDPDQKQLDDYAIAGETVTVTE